MASAPTFAPAPAARPAAPNPNAAVPAVAGDAPPTSDAPTTVARNAPAAAPSTGAAPTTDAAAIPAVPTAESLQTVAKNYPVTAEGNARFLATYATMPGVKTLDGGVMYRALVTGKGTTSPLGRLDTVTVSYRGWLIDGTSFDNSPIGTPRSFQLAQLIEGWRTALLKMKTGDLWEIVVPSPLAYGAEGRPGRIPPNQALIFVISLGKVEYAG
jgi:FKBP-type peptidyl-prolyl cis-trans isomerase